MLRTMHLQCVPLLLVYRGKLLQEVFLAWLTDRLRMYGLFQPFSKGYTSQLRSSPLDFDANVLGVQH